MKVQQPTRISEAEFLSWPEALTKIELIDGDVVCSPGPTPNHQEVLVRLLLALRAWAQGRAVTVGIAPTDIRFAPDRILQPDVFVILEPIRYKVKGPITRIPEVCVEVLSDDVAYDRMTKRLLYAAAGVRELWAVSPNGWIERWIGPGLATREILTDVLRSPLLPDFELDVPSLFPEA